MALFSRNTKADSKGKESAAPIVKKQPEVSGARETDRDLASLLITPRVTEKSVRKGEQNVYTFLIRKHATKHDVRDAIKALFNVTPVKVNIVNKQGRTYMSRSKGRKVSERGHKKAYVYLAAGDKIDIA